MSLESTSHPMDFTTGLLHTQAAGSLLTALGNKEGGVGILIPDLLLHFRSPEHWEDTLCGLAAEARPSDRARTSGLCTPLILAWLWEARQG